MKMTKCFNVDGFIENKRYQNGAQESSMDTHNNNCQLIKVIRALVLV